ncbi:MAG: exo-beta-N-acetylmuramidase NamZ domain-containing protein, partial [Armatimonadota bacterium]
MKKIDGEGTVRLGVECFWDRDELKSLRFGMLTNALATTSEFVPSVDTLLAAGFQISALFVPEHGFYGAALAGEKIASSYDEKRGVPVFSLYGETLKPKPDWLEGLDALLVDLPDVGCRFYTYAWTMSYLIEVAAEVNLPVFVLDRPNPINGIQIEGKCQKEIVGSLVGRFPIPIRHGMTLGELAIWLQRHFFTSAKVEVIKCEGWKRTMWWDETGLPWVSPSPAMATLDTATVYCGTCLIEGTNLSEGRGTSHPFEWIGAPLVDEDEVANLLNSLGLTGVKFRPIRFVPATSKHAGEVCKGVQVHVTDRNKFSPVRTGLCIIAAFKQLYRQNFAWREATFDRLMGTKLVREAMDETDEPIAVALELDLSPDDEFTKQRS